MTVKTLIPFKEKYGFFIPFQLNFTLKLNKFPHQKRKKEFGTFPFIIFVLYYI